MPIKKEKPNVTPDHHRIKRVTFYWDPDGLFTLDEEHDREKTTSDEINRDTNSINIDEKLLIAKNENRVSVSLENSDLTQIPSKVFELSQIKHLNLSNNSINEIPAEIAQLSNLQSLILDGNTEIDLSNLLSQVNLKELSLNNCRLTKIPDEIFHLKNLMVLHLDNNLILHLPPDVGNLGKLKILTLPNNGIETIPPSIGLLNDLRVMNLSSNGLTGLPKEFKYLSHLKILNLSNNKFKKFPKIILQLKALHTLIFANGNVYQFPNGIENLDSLKKLDLRGCHLSNISPAISKLHNLEELSLSNNNIKELPNEIRTLNKLRLLEIIGNPLLIPPEISVQSENPTSILDFYFSSKTNKFPLNEIKLIFVGQGSVGKTSIIERITKNTYVENQSKTEGIAISQWKIAVGDLVSKDSLSGHGGDEQIISANIWDFGGQEIMHATHQFFLTKRSLYLLVLDSRLTQEENRVEYWLKIIRSFSRSSPVLIIGNKIDQHPLDIDRKGLKEKYPNIVGILEVSAAKNIGIDELKRAIIKRINKLHHVRDPLPENWFVVKSRLEDLRRKSNFITQDEYLSLCSKNDVTDEDSQQILIGFLHDLGIVLYFQDDPRLTSLGILNPQWVTNGVYKIINSHTLFQKQGVLTLSMLDEILNLPEYPRNKRIFIVELMKRFELCYELKKDKIFLVPDLLSKNEPVLDFKGTPAFEYLYPILPSSVITRFIVRMNQKIHDGGVWRTGVLLKIDQNLVLVKADQEDRVIRISIDGIEHTRRDALSAIRYVLDEIHATIKGLNPKKRVPVPNEPDAEPLDYEFLLMLDHYGDETTRVKSKNRLVTVDVRKVLSGIEDDARRFENRANITNIYVAGDVKGSNIISGDKNNLSGR
jgi:internalin A